MSGVAALDGLAPEFRALILALRRRLHPEDDGRALGDSLAAVRDWPALLSGVRRHRIAPLVWPPLRDAGAVPEAAAARLRAMAERNRHNCLLQAAEVLRLQRLFAEDHCPLLVLKGLVLSQALYGDPTLRGVGDIDLLVAGADLPRADALLRAAGYRAPQAAGSPAALRYCKELVYQHPAGHAVELHQRLLHNPALLPIPFAELWRLRDTVSVGGQGVATLPAAVLPHYLMLHGTYHCWDRLCWLADLHVLLAPPDRRRAALDDAAALGVAAPLTLALELADSWLGTSAVTPAAPTRRIIAGFFARRRWLERPARGSPAWFAREIRRRWLLYRLKGTWRHFAQEMAADIHNPVDAEILPLPAALAWLYPVLRPLGWVVRTLRGRGEP